MAKSHSPPAGETNSGTKLSNKFTTNTPSVEIVSLRAQQQKDSTQVTGISSRRTKVGEARSHEAIRKSAKELLSSPPPPDSRATRNTQRRLPPAAPTLQQRSANYLANRPNDNQMQFTFVNNSREGEAQSKFKPKEVERSPSGADISSQLVMHHKKMQKFESDLFEQSFELLGLTPQPELYEAPVNSPPKITDFRYLFSPQLKQNLAKRSSTSSQSPPPPLGQNNLRASSYLDYKQQESEEPGGDLDQAMCTASFAFQN